jgi:hypothetical protein
LIVDASLDGAAPTPFILDTGGHDILTAREAARRGLRLAGAGKSYGAGSGSTPTRFTRIGSLALGTARLGPQPFTVLALDLGTTRAPNGRTVPVAGILGLEIFERFVVTLGPRSASFARVSALRARCHDMPLAFTGDMPLVTAYVDGARGVFGIDTGNNQDPILFAHFLREHGISTEGAADGQMAASSVGGSMALAHARITQLELGPTVFKNIAVEVSSMRSGTLSTRSEAGNIGLSLLARFASVTFDYRHHRMCVEPRG